MKVALKINVLILCAFLSSTCYAQNVPVEEVVEKGIKKRTVSYNHTNWRGKFSKTDRLIFEEYYNKTGRLYKNVEFNKKGEVKNETIYTYYTNGSVSNISTIEDGDTLVESYKMNQYKLIITGGVPEPDSRSLVNEEGLIEEYFQDNFKYLYRYEYY